MLIEIGSYPYNLTTESSSSSFIGISEYCPYLNIFNGNTNMITIIIILILTIIGT